MKILILGGTAWLGRTIAESALRAGHDVTCVARGTDVAAGVALVQADRDTDTALEEVAKTHWNAVIDVARQPGHVRHAVRDLARSADHYVFVSSCSAYASQREIGADETAELLPPLIADTMESPEQYGSAKVACEQAVIAGFGAARAAIIRAGLIGGPGDPSDRTTYWPLRFAHPSNPEGRVLVPDAPELPTAIVDVRDLAGWILRLAETHTGGIFNAQGDAVPLPDHLAVARAVAGHTGSVVAATAEWLGAQDVAEWSGSRSLPLWLADRDWYGMNARSTVRARAAGLELRPLAETLADVLAAAAAVATAGTTPAAADPARGAATPAAAGSTPAEPSRAAGLTDADERTLLAAL